MRIVKRGTLIAFWEQHAETEQPLKSWWKEVKKADWSSSNEVLLAYSKAKILQGHRVRFEISGGNYRLIVKFNYHYRMGYIRFIGTHAEYDRIDAETI